MGFFSDLQFVKNYISAKLNIEEFENTVLAQEKNIKQLNSDVFHLTGEIEKLTKKKNELQESIQKLYESKCKCEEGLNNIYSLDSRAFIKNLLENGYEIYRLSNIEEIIGMDKDYIIPVEVKRYIDLKIQEFSAIENIDFEYLRKVLYSINKVWEETYNEIGDKKNYLYNYTNNIGIWKAITSFMMIRKKEDLQ